MTHTRDPSGHDQPPTTPTPEEPPMPTFPYTDDDILRAAIHAHRTLTTRMDTATANHALSLQPDWPWGKVRSEDRQALAKRVIDLVAGAPSMAQWAVELGAAGLDQTDSHSWSGTEGLDVAIQIAAHPRVLPAIRREMMRAAQAGIEDVYAKFLGKEPLHHVPSSAR